jgi:hypothetical protein
MEPGILLPCSQKPLVPILSQIGLIHTILSDLSKIHFNIVHPPTSSHTATWSQKPQNKNYLGGYTQPGYLISLKN